MNPNYLYRKIYQERMIKKIFNYMILELKNKKIKKLLDFL